MTYASQRISKVLLRVAFAIKSQLTSRKASLNELPGTSLTLRQLFLLVGGVATVVTCINCGFTFVSHFYWRTNYREQKQ